MCIAATACSSADAAIVEAKDAGKRHGHVELGLERAREAVRVALGFDKLRLRGLRITFARVRVRSKRPGDLLEKLQIGLRRLQPFPIARRAPLQRSNFGF